MTGFSGGEIILGNTAKGSQRTLEDGVIKVASPPPNPVYRVDMICKDGEGSQMTAWSRRSDAREALLDLADQLARLSSAHRLDQLRRYETQEVPAEILSKILKMERRTKEFISTMPGTHRLEQERSSNA